MHPNRSGAAIDSTDLPAASPGGLDAALGRFISAPVKAQTWRNLLFLVLALPIGLVEFVLFAVGLPLGFGLIVTLFGFPILLAVLGSTVPLASLERGLASRLLRVRFHVRPQPSEAGGWWPCLRAWLADSATWRAVAYLVTRLPLGLIAFVALTAGLGLSGALLTAPLHFWTGTLDFGPWRIDTLLESVLAVPVGGLALLASLHALNALSGLLGAWARATL